MYSDTSLQVHIYTDVMQISCVIYCRGSSATCVESYPYGNCIFSHINPRLQAEFKYVCFDCHVKDPLKTSMLVYLIS